MQRVTKINNRQALGNSLLVNSKGSKEHGDDIAQHIGTRKALTSSPNQILEGASLYGIYALPHCALNRGAGADLSVELTNAVRKHSLES